MIAQAVGHPRQLKAALMSISGSRVTPKRRLQA
jgi:hypothetical protein